jgi:pimeloyl-ACP methyl ester carboxylesterase
MPYFYKLLILLFFTVPLHAFEGLIKEPIFNEYVYVKTQGNPQKEIIVFVHGLGNEASTVWDETIEQLKEDYFILTFDLSGFGKSSKSKQAYTITNYSRLLFFLINQYCSKPFYLVGHSMGGAIALKFASDNSTQVKKLMIIDAAGILHQEAYSKSLITSKLDELFNAKYPNETNDSKMITFLSLLLGKVQSLFGLNDLVEHGTAQSVAAYSLGTEDFGLILPKINVDTFILWGENDTIAPKRTAYSLYKFIPNSKLDIISHSGHVPMKDAFHNYFSFLKEFLKGKIEYPKEKTHLAQYEDILVIENQKNKIVKGNYRQIIINNSQNILIEKANINSIEMFNSSVHLRHCTINSYNTAGVIRNSSLMITSSNIFASTAFVTNSSKLDIAGSEFYADKIITNSKPSENTHIVISISKQIKKEKSKILHGKYILIHSQSL